jgi:feruloyl esterase
VNVVARVAAALLAVAWGAGAAAAQGDACAALLARDFQGVPDAPTVLTSAVVAIAANGLPSHCHVRGAVAPQVHFELHLPLPPAWNGRLLMQGCGGLCGATQPATCEDALARHYATVVTDMGHSGAAWQAHWARDNLPAEIDFAYRATHVVAVAAKAVLVAYYGRPQERAYFRGCSTGGRQALIEAQRFPADFDGIIAGAPVLSETGISALHLIWSGRANLDAQGRPILSADDVALLHEGVLAVCDGADGLRDGIIEEPTACAFEPESLACGRAPPGRCLSPEQVAAARRLYDGARDSAGRPLTPGGLAKGSEREWVPNFVGRDGPATFHPAGPVSALYRYLIFMPDPGSVGTAADFDFDRDPPRLALMESLYSPTNPDLRAFRARGGRLILYHGWDDAEIPASHMLDYFGMVERAMGGREETRKFARLFMLPGVAHCRRGPGADAVDWLSYLEAWVERGEAPDAVVAHHLAQEENYLGLPRKRFPLAPAEYDRARPVFAWPNVARFTGRGDPAQPEGWRRVRRK